MDSSFPISRHDLRIRDPFIVANGKQYLMYAQAGNRTGSDYQGVEAYISNDLQQWSLPIPVLHLSDPGIQKVWAPEVHRLNGRWNLLVTLTFPDLLPWDRPAAIGNAPWHHPHARGTWLYRANDPLGPFDAQSGILITPPNAMALDGTLYQDDSGTWLIYCHEWVQLVDGLMIAQRLDHNMLPASEPPVTLFSASDAPCAPSQPSVGKITDGPFLFRCAKSPSLFMLWSTNDIDGTYVLLAAESPCGVITGPWKHQHILLHSNGGHGMVFTDLGGRTCIAVHEPNTGSVERLRLLHLDASGSHPRILGDVS
jgi:arabinan endo-1,5-alpha-L-arabinosidase